MLTAKGRRLRSICQCLDEMISLPLNHRKEL